MTLNNDKELELSNASKPRPSSALQTSCESMFQQQSESMTEEVVNMVSNAALELGTEIYKIPGHRKTWEIHQALMPRGNISRIKLSEPVNDGNCKGEMEFRPAPKTSQFLHQTMSVNNFDDSMQQLPVDVSKLGNSRPQTERVEQRPPDAIFLLAIQLEVGILEEDRMKVLFRAEDTTKVPIKLGIHTRYNEVEIQFGLEIHDTHLDLGPNERTHNYKVKIPFSQIRKLYIMTHNDNGNETSLIFDFEMPPKLYRKTYNEALAHNPKSLEWNENRAWYRQTGIRKNPKINIEVTQLQQKDSILDLGRWLSYRITIDRITALSEGFSSLMQILADHNVQATKKVAMDFDLGDPGDVWAWTDEFAQAGNIVSNSASLSGLHAALSPISQLKFNVCYLFEACLSQYLLRESNITHAFLERLLIMESKNAEELLEKVFDDKRRYRDSMDIFDMQSQISGSIKEIPRYCNMVRSVIVTPSTIFIATPVMETSNRIVRKYSHYQDRFLRVKFSDELYLGKIMNADDNTNNEIFTRIKRTMKNGIKIANRHYEFLAYGSSQMREGGAYFFAAIGEITADSIRAKMGDFTEIKEVAKYAARLGQCLSTTRDMSIGVRAETIPDIKRNGYCFTDGVGKISPFMAQMIAEEYGLFNTTTEYPSVFQYRFGGHKGVLAVDPSLKGNVIQTRPSQKKFPAEHRRLEICRISQFSSAYLNVQIILILEALGVPASVFVGKMKEALFHLNAALSDENKAQEQLRRHVDFNSMSLTLAQMIGDGFMASEDPFMISCVRLWVAWMIKYLKEKARIFVSQGAFVLACVDETATLQGHFDRYVERTNEQISETTCLPEIFLQIPDPDRKGVFKVVTGICILARNPSLHPGDIRVVRAVDVPSLRHLKNCVVLPQTGDRDLANMCAGGDLDGDDYLVMWDPDLIPVEWNHAPMDYKGPKPVRSDRPVTIDAITSFFVMHMKNDNLPRLATAHKFWADREKDSVKSEKCLELAALHSMAVDYAKTGVPAQFPDRLRFKGPFPHWSERRNSTKSTKVIGQIFDAVDRMPFNPAWGLPFDKRILTAYELDEQIERSAREVKQQYDTAMRRLMAQYGIKDEFQAWTAFVMDHNQSNDYKFAQDFGEKVLALKQWAQNTCFARADTNAKERAWEKMAPFIVAMYTITAKEMTDWKVQNSLKDINSQGAKTAQPRFENVPLMSFPWIFSTELGHIANKRRPIRPAPPQKTATAKKPEAKWELGLEILSVDMAGIPIEGIEIADSIVQNGGLLESPHLDGELARDVYRQHDAADAQRKTGAGFANVSSTPPLGPVLPHASLKTLTGPAQANNALICDPTAVPLVRSLMEGTESETLSPQPPNQVRIGDECSERHPSCENDGDSNDEAGEIVIIDIPDKPSALEALERLVGG